MGTKTSFSALLVQERSRVPLPPKKRTRGEVTAATTWSNQKKQCTTTRNKGCVSRMSYHRVPLNYPEKNKRERIPRSTWRKPMNSVSHETVIQTKDKYRRSPWVSKESLRVKACESKISYATVRWDYWDFTSSIIDMNIIFLRKESSKKFTMFITYMLSGCHDQNHVHIVIGDSKWHKHN